MPYSLPSSTATATTISSTDMHATTPSMTSSPFTHAHFSHRRTRSSNTFSDEKGPGAFVSLGTLPRSHRKALFHINVPDEDESPPSPPRSYNNELTNANGNTIHLSKPSPALRSRTPPPTRIDLPPPAGFAPDSVPFPTSSPTCSPDVPTPFFAFQPPSVPSSGPSPLTRTPSTPIILSNGKPLKSSFKSSSSSPNIPHLAVSKHLRAQSAPSTPICKNVHFAEKDEGLEMVRVFNKGGKPASLSKPSGDETETETEAEPAYPFPLFSPSTPPPSASASSQPVIYELDPTPGFTSPIPRPSPSPYANIHLETIVLPRTRPPMLRGTVLVRNISFEKTVAVRFTMDDWQTTSEVLCGYNASLPGLPPPFPHPKTVGDVVGMKESDSQWDRFSFTIRLEDYEHKLADRTLWLVARYTPGSGGEFWDNNDGKNYRVNFRRARTSSPIPSPAGSSLGLVGMFNPSPSSSIQVRANGEAHAQQRTFSAPSTLKTTPTTGFLGHGQEAIDEKAKSRVHGLRSDSPAMVRSISLPITSSSSSLPSIPPPQPQPHLASAAAPVTARFVSRRLSLSNYARPGSSTGMVTGVDLGEPVTPPLTPPESSRTRSKSLPGSAHTRQGAEDGDYDEAEQKDDDESTNLSGANSPSTTAESSVVSTPSNITPTGRAPSTTLEPLADFPWAASSSLGLGFGFGLDKQGAKTNSGGLLSPPRSVDTSPNGSGKSSPIRRKRSPSPPQSFQSTPTQSSPSITTPPASVSPVPSQSSTPTPRSAGFGLSLDIPSLSVLQDEPMSPRVDPSDSSYAAFVRQWCFAGAGAAAPPAAASGTATDSKATSEKTAPGAGAAAASRGHGHQSPSHGGYGFPGFGFGLVDAGMVGAHMR